MNIVTIKSDFFSTGYPFPFIPILDKRNHPLFITYHKELKGILSSDDLEWFKNWLVGEMDDRWFCFHLLNVIESLPISFLKLILSSALGTGVEVAMAKSILDNAVRLFGFIEVETQLQNMYKQAQLPITKYFVLNLIAQNTIQDNFEFKDHKIILYGKTTYEWQTDRYRRRSDDSETTLKDYGKLLNQIIHARFTLILEEYLKKDQSPELLRLLITKFPHSRNDCPEELLELYEQALKKSDQ